MLMIKFKLENVSKPETHQIIGDKKGEEALNTLISRLEDGTVKKELREADTAERAEFLSTLHRHNRIDTLSDEILLNEAFVTASPYHLNYLLDTYFQAFQEDPEKSLEGALRISDYILSNCQDTGLLTLWFNDQGRIHSLGNPYDALEKAVNRLINDLTEKLNEFNNDDRKYEIQSRLRKLTEFAEQLSKPTYSYERYDMKDM